MKSDELLDLIGETEDGLIHDAKQHQKTKKFPKWARWSSAIAACLVVAIGIGGFIFPRLGGNSASGGEGGGHDDRSSSFMSYAGPVFPLTLLEENSSISAQRNITMDFAPWVPVWISNEEEAASHTWLSAEEQQKVLSNYNEWYPEGGRHISSGDILVTDSYILTNDSDEDQTVSILYPFVSSLNDLADNLPGLTCGGEVLDTTLHAGSYAGGFEGAWENWAETGENPGSLNLDGIESWEGYRDLLAGDTYLQRALGDFVDLSDIPVTVYAFTDPWGEEENDDEGIPNPSIRVMCDIDYENSTVLSYGFHAGYWDKENGVLGKGFSIPQENERDYGKTYYLIVIGDDVENMECQGYVTGGWDTDKTIEAGVTITRSESDLETALRIIADCNYQELVDVGNYYEDAPEYGFELYYGLLKEHLVGYGVLSDNGAERYSTGSIEDLDVTGVARVFWLETEITVPADGSMTLSAAFQKDPSYDFYCSGSENTGISGYDLVTALGSNLSITDQSATLEDRGQIEIVRQNFGFDLENGINEVTLDSVVPHYYLEVRSAAQEDQ